jgi:hypothetical protein
MYFLPLSLCLFLLIINFRKNLKITHPINLIFIVYFIFFYIRYFYTSYLQEFGRAGHILNFNIYTANALVVVSTFFLICMFIFFFFDKDLYRKYEYKILKKNISDDRIIISIIIISLLSIVIFNYIFYKKNGTISFLTSPYDGTSTSDRWEGLFILRILITAIYIPFFYYLNKLLDKKLNFKKLIFFALALLIMIMSVLINGTKGAYIEIAIILIIFLLDRGLNYKKIAFIFCLLLLISILFYKHSIVAHNLNLSINEFNLFDFFTRIYNRFYFLEYIANTLNIFSSDNFLNNKAFFNLYENFFPSFLNLEKQPIGDQLCIGIESHSSYNTKCTSFSLSYFLLDGGYTGFIFGAIIIILVLKLWAFLYRLKSDFGKAIYYYYFINLIFFFTIEIGQLIFMTYKTLYLVSLIIIFRKKFTITYEKQI